MTTTRRSLSAIKPTSDNVQRLPETPGKVVKTLQAKLEEKDSENKNLRSKVDDLTKALDALNLVKNKIATTSNDKDVPEKKTKKDKDAPVPAKTAYKFFCEATPAAEGVDMRKVWKECAPEIREKFTAMAQADKARFDTENTSYEQEKAALELYYKNQKQEMAMEFFEAHQAAQAALAQAENDKKKKKSKKDPEAPKRPMSSYLFFAQEKRESVMKKNPDAPLAEVSKILGDLWKAQKNTKKYDKMAADAKAAYDEEKAAYDAMVQTRKEADAKEKAEKLVQDKEEAMKLFKSVTPSVTNAPAPTDEISVLTDDNTKASKVAKKKKDPNAPKRALSAYNYFVTDNLQTIKSKMTGTDIKTADVMKEVARQWKELPDDKKKKYNKLAEQDKKRHTTEMESYKAKQQPSA